MSFSADVKTECCEVHGKHLHCLRAELAGLVLLSGTISLGSVSYTHLIGIFITGESGVGKSETALELVKRGHRLRCV